MNKTRDSFRPVISASTHVTTQPNPTQLQQSHIDPLYSAPYHCLHHPPLFSSFNRTQIRIPTPPSPLETSPTTQTIKAIRTTINPNTTSGSIIDNKTTIYPQHGLCAVLYYHHYCTVLQLPSTVPQTSRQSHFLRIAPTTKRRNECRPH